MTKISFLKGLTSFRLLLLFTGILFLLLGCKKQGEQSESSSLSNIQAKKIVIETINNIKGNTTVTGAEKFEKIEKGLEFAKLWIEKETDSSQLIIVPLAIQFETLKNIKAGSQMYLVLEVNKSNKIVRKNIFSYIPASESTLAVSKGCFSKIFTDNTATDDGQFIALSLTGSYNYDKEFKNGSLKKAGVPLKKPANQAASRTESGVICIDWYHVTYYYDADGYYMYKDEEYLGQSCYTCGEITPWGQALQCDYLNDDPIGGGIVGTPLEDTQKSWMVAAAQSGSWMISSTERFSGVNDPSKGGKQFTAVIHLGDLGYALSNHITLTWTSQGTTTSFTAWTATSHITGRVTAIDNSNGQANSNDLCIDQFIDKNKTWVVNEIW